MKQLAQQALPTSLGGFRPATSLLTTAINQRTAMMVQLSGYPVASHVVDHIQRSFKFDTVKDLLESIITLRNLVRLAADVLSTIPLANVSKQQLNRKEISDYIAANASSLGASSVSVTSNAKLLDLVAYMITSSETPAQSWLLDMSDTAADNKFVAIHKLYESIAAGSTGSDFVYNPESDTVVTLGDLRRFKDLSARSKTADQKAEYNSVMENQKTLVRLAHVRLVDHVFSLVNDVHVWEHFISVRKSPDPAQNDLRAQGLKVFASYLHSLLMYFHIWSVETFMATYRRLEEWVTTFPSIPAHIIDQYNNIVRKHDVLGAQVDAAAVLAAFDQDKNNPLHSAIRILPTDFVDAFGLKKVLAAVTTAAAATAAPISAVQNLNELTNANYTHLLLATPVASFNLISDISEHLMMQGAVAQEINHASAGVLIGLSRYYSDELINQMKRIGLRIPFNYVGKVPHVTYVKETTNAAIEGGSLDITYQAPAASYDYQQYVRETLAYKIFPGSHAAIQDYYPKFLTHRDEAKRLRTILGTEWKSLYPSWLTNGSQAYTTAMLRAEPESVKLLLEMISGQPFDLIKRTITNPYMRENWATILSSFATLYVVPAETKLEDILTDEGKLTAVAVTGHGKPYGVEYPALTALQGAATADDFVKVSDFVYLRIHKLIPAPSRHLAIERDFHLSHRRYYFSGNDDAQTLVAVKKWVFDEGLLHQALVPYKKLADRPLALLDKRYAYSNDYMLLQLDLRYDATSALMSYERINVAPSVREWKQDKFIYFITHNTFGAYCAAAEGASAVEEQNDVQALISKAEQEIKNVEKSAMVQPERVKAPAAAISEGAYDTGLNRESAKSGGKRNKKQRPNQKSGKNADATKAGASKGKDAASADSEDGDIADETLTK